MTTEPATIQGKPPERPALTAQKTKSNRVQYVAIFGTLTLLVVYFGVYPSWQEYFRDPTSEHLFIAVVVSCSFWVFPLALAYLVVPKVEFFENHLVARSLWGFSRKRNYQGISKLEVKHEHLDLMFYGGDQLSLSREDIKIEDLAAWLAERSVVAARNLKWEPRETYENWGVKQDAVEAVTLQNEATSSPVLTVQAPRSDRIRKGLFWGAVFVVSVIIVVGYAGRYFSNERGVDLFVVIFGIFLGIVCLFFLALRLIPKVEFFENHIVARSIWGRSKRRSYHEISKLEVKYDLLILKFTDRGTLALSRYEVNPGGFLQWLAERGVTAARDLKWERRLEESL